MAARLEHNTQIPDHVLLGPVAEYNKWMDYAKGQMVRDLGTELLQQGHIKFDTVGLPPAATGVQGRTAPAETPHLRARFEFEPRNHTDPPPSVVARWNAEDRAESEARVHRLREGRVLEIEGLQKWFEELEDKMVEGASAAIFFHYVEGKLAERLKTLKGRLE